ncbi:MAG: hypothetical protein AAB863_02230 [Patescibacteria group bacterium]
MKKVSFFFLPIAVVLLMLEIIVFFSGEFMPIKKVVNLQNYGGKEIIFGREIADQSMRKYKYLNVLSKKPEVLVLGSSRVMQIREEMFDVNTKFYNAGGIAHNIADLVDFIRLLPDDVKPDTIILGIDFYWFGDKSDLIYGVSDDLKKIDDAYQWSAHLYVDRFLLLQIAKNPSYINKIFNKKDPIDGKFAIGLQALSGDGFRNDGSYQYGSYIQESEKGIVYIDREKTLDRIKYGTSPFKKNSVFNEERLDLLSEFLRISKEKGIKVVGLAPPFSAEVLSSLESSVYYKELLNNFETRVPEIFTKFGFSFFNYSDQSSVNINNLYMFDGMHSSETAMARILLDVSDSFGLQAENNFKLAPDLSAKLSDEKTTSIQINW